MRGAAVAVDVGGTFTDVTLLTESGQAFSTKVQSDRERPERAVSDGVMRVLEQASVSPARVTRIMHATTLATNCVLEQSGPTVALITTLGFRHVLEIGRHDGPRRTSMLTWKKPPRPVSPSNVFEIKERTGYDGSVLVPLDESSSRRLGSLLRERGITSIAISFINAYASSGHEERAAALIAAEHPEASISLSSQVLPSLREYERTLATALNAYVMPSIDRYFRDVGEALDRLGVAARSFVMQSNGGHISAAEARQRPITLVLSGPAASATAAADLARRSRLNRAISVDMGGTSTDVCVLHGGEPESTDEAQVGPWPFALPSVDIHTIGAGGGSIARVARDGSITVGPDSAGADPGPVCYGSGGTMPTVTDANLVLGRLPALLAGGGIKLDLEAAQAAIEKYIATPLGLDIEAAAAGVIEVVNSNMVGAIRLLTTQRGRDPRDYALIAAGGAGPLHAAEVGHLLGCSRILLPPAPGVHSTLGLLGSPLRRVFLATHVALFRDCDPAAVEAILARLDADAQAWFEAEGVRLSARRTARYAVVHFVDQVGEILVEWKGVSALEPSLHRAHRDLFGYVPDQQSGEMLGLRLVATAAARPPAAAVTVSSATESEKQRRVYVSRTAGFHDAAVYDRPGLTVGSTFEGPAIVEQMDSTTYVPPQFRCSQDGHGNLILVRRQSASR
jgi:N-methylhydantoinase A